MESRVELVWVEQVFEYTEGPDTYKVVFTSSEVDQRLRRVYHKYTGDEVTGEKKNKIVEAVLSSDVFKRRGSNCLD